MEIAEKLRDALSMFWQALDTDERRFVVGAVAWAIVTVGANVYVQSRRYEREQIADAVARRLTVG